MADHPLDPLTELLALDRELCERPPARPARARSLTTRRAKVRSQIDPEVLAKYDRLGQAGSAPPVAGVAQGACTGCQIRLPRQVIEDARFTPGLVRCPSCGRVILLARDVHDAGRSTQHPVKNVAM